MAKKLTCKIARERIRELEVPRPPAGMIERFRATGPDSSLVSDVMDMLGLVGAIAASTLAPSITGAAVVGPALTVRNVPLDGSKTPFERAAANVNGMAEMEAHNLAEEGDVVVIAGVTGLSNMGGVSATIAKRQGVAAAIVEGGIRDLNQSRAVNFPLWATELTPVTGKWRLETIEINGDISLCGLKVRCGDIIVADDTGVCVIPIEHAEAVLQLCEKKFALEQKRLRAVADGAEIADLPKA